MDGPPAPEPGTVSRFVVACVQLPSLAWTCCSIMDSVHCRNNRVHDGVTSLSTPGHTAPPSVPSEASQASRPSLHLGVLGADLTNRDPSSGAAQHTASTKHPSPVACRLRRLAPDRLAVARSEFDSMLRTVQADVPRELGHPLPSRAQEGPVEGRVITDP